MTLTKMMVAGATKKNEAQRALRKTMSTPMKGATAVEYILIVSIMAAVILIVFKVLGNSMKGRGNEVGNVIKNGG